MFKKIYKSIMFPHNTSNKILNENDYAKLDDSLYDEYNLEEIKEIKKLIPSKYKQSRFRDTKEACSNLNIKIEDKYDALLFFITLNRLYKSNNIFIRVAREKIEEVIKNKIKGVHIYYNKGSVEVYLLGLNIKFNGVKGSEFIKDYEKSYENRRPNGNYTTMISCNTKIVNLARIIRHKMKIKDSDTSSKRIMQLRCKEHGEFKEGRYIILENNDLYIMESIDDKQDIFKGDLCKLTYQYSYKNKHKIDKRMLNIEKIEKLVYKYEYKDFVVLGRENTSIKDSISKYSSEIFARTDIQEGDICRVNYKVLYNSEGKVKSNVHSVEKVEDTNNRVKTETEYIDLIVYDRSKSEEYIDSELYSYINISGRSNRDFYLSLEGNIDLTIIDKLKDEYEIKNYIDRENIQHGDLITVYYKKIIVDERVIKCEILKLEKQETISHKTITENLKVNNIDGHWVFDSLIEFENGCKYIEKRYPICIDPCPTPEQAARIYNSHYINSKDICEVTYIKIFKNGMDTGKTFVIKAEKIRK